VSDPLRGEDLAGMGGGFRRSLHVACLRPALHHVDERVLPRLALVLVDEGKSGDAALRGDQQGLAERTGVEAVDHLQSFAAALVVTWRHSLMGDEEVVQSAATR